MAEETVLRVHETFGPDELPLCYVAEVKAQGLEPDPRDWETSAEPVVPGPYPLPITCQACLELMHA